MTQTKQTFPVRLDVEFSDFDIDENIIYSGLWQYNWWVDYQPTIDGWRITTVDPDTGRDQRCKNVSRDDIRRVMGNILADAYPHPDYYSLAKQQILDGIMRSGDFDFDADGADQIMQIAVFGEVIYG